jgi:hypothetical protein
LSSSSSRSSSSLLGSFLGNNNYLDSLLTTSAAPANPANPTTTTGRSQEGQQEQQYDYLVGVLGDLRKYCYLISCGGFFFFLSFQVGIEISTFSSPCHVLPALSRLRHRST